MGGKQNYPERGEIPEVDILIQDVNKKYQINLSDRLMEFTANTISLLHLLPYFKEYDVFRSQISKSVTSIGANYEESQASSYPEFRQRIRICLRESRETNYWFRLIEKLYHKRDDSTKVQNTEFIKKLQSVINESHEIVLIFGAISSRINAKMKKIQ